ncbi:MAG: ribosome biogenesis GTPase Der, partial [Acidimicrobiaceae bacterium]|nr:ribosome biogenesis GTPase Der [Acidimicrobiaceae bacterium]
MTLPIVAVVGCPNVGKSTLVNRIVGRRETIVEPRPGVTRDRKVLEAEWLGHHFRLLDTGGWTADGDLLDDKVSKQSELAMAQSDVVLFVIDATIGVRPDDQQVVKHLRRSKVPVLLVANKVDDASHEHSIWELMGLGLGDPFPVSALHGRGTGDLLDEVVRLLPGDPSDTPAELADHDPAAHDPNMFAVALVGRPNVGKSTLFNRLIGEERAIVHDRPGTTRDAIDTIVETDHGPIRFIDTAGMRRKARIAEDTEYYSLLRALKAVDSSDVALLVIDATVGVTHQDQRLAERVDGAGCPIVILLNKWELLDTVKRTKIAEDVERKLGFLGDSPVLRISALSGKGVNRLWPAIQT